MIKLTLEADKKIGNIYHSKYIMLNLSSAVKEFYAEEYPDDFFLKQYNSYPDTYHNIGTSGTVTLEIVLRKHIYEAFQKVNNSKWTIIEIIEDYQPKLPWS